MDGSLDLAALRKLRDASGALKEYFGDGDRCLVTRSRRCQKSGVKLLRVASTY